MGSHCTGTHCSPSCLSFPTSRCSGRTGQWPPALWAGWVGKEVLGAGGKGLCPQEGGRGGLRVGLEEVCVSVCSQEGCACGMGRETDQFSLAGARRLLLSWSVVTATALGDGAGASAPVTSFYTALQSLGPWRGLQHHGDAGPHLCQHCDPRAWALHIPRAHPARSGPGWSPGAAPWVRPRDSSAGTGLTELLPSPRPCRGGRFTGCQSRGQRSAGVRKSISVRSLSTSFNLMKPLFVKAAALPAIPLKPSRAQRPALKEQEGVPFPFAFAIQQAPKTNTPHTEI